jgi:hypothetical protein
MLVFLLAFYLLAHGRAQHAFEECVEQHPLAETTFSARTAASKESGGENGELCQVKVRELVDFFEGGKNAASRCNRAYRLDVRCPSTHWVSFEREPWSVHSGSDLLDVGFRDRPATYHSSKHDEYEVTERFVWHRAANRVELYNEDQPGPTRLTTENRASTNSLACETSLFIPWFFSGPPCLASLEAGAP